jgi:alpha-galactosidase
MKTMRCIVMSLGLLTAVSMISNIGYAAETSAENHTVWLSGLDLSKMTAGWGKPQIDQSVQSKPITIAGKKFDKGVGTHADSVLYVDLRGTTERFSAAVGVDDEVAGQPGTVRFRIIGDDKELWSSGVMKAGEPAKSVDVSLKGIKVLILSVDTTPDGAAFDHADWADARFLTSGDNPQAIAPPAEDEVLLTPAPGPAPKINGPKVYGVRPNSPFLYRIPCTGTRPIEFAAENLPAGLSLDAKTGIITGKLAQAGANKTTLIAKNAQGQDRRDFFIVVGETLALTPPMGWNSWYIHYNRVTDAILRQSADVMIASGMADFGYQYVNIDDCWMVKVKSDDPEIGGPTRDDKGRLLGNKRFPDMKAMTDYIHAKGLKAGIYISPGPRTCAGYEGSFEHEALDAKTFAEWGFDFLKYDWCSYAEKAGGDKLENFMKPYQVMYAEILKQDRDIVLNLCQYGMGDVWKWGAQVGHCWRTTGDLGLEKSASLPGFYSIGMSNAKHFEFAKPGGWNDPDYILIGWVGSAFTGGEGEKTSLTANEQYSYMSMWSLMAAPLIFSGDMAKLDAFALNILCNGEVIEVDQDPLGKQARILRQTDREFVLVKDLEDGSKAVGLFNLDIVSQPLAVSWKDLGLTGKQRVRDLWRQKDIGVLDGEFKTSVPRHGVSFIRLFPAQ